MAIKLRQMKNKKYFRGKYLTSSIRLKNWDYRNAGKYFITICTKNRAFSFGSISDEKMELNELGQFAFDYLNGLNSKKENVRLLIHIVMPNHMHAILELKGVPGEKQSNSFGQLQTDSLSSIVNQYKGKVTQYATRNHLPWEGWQSRFHDHIIRNDQDYENIYNYIVNNPAQWQKDRFYH
jgi:putative transposase